MPRYFFFDMSDQFSTQPGFYIAFANTETLTPEQVEIYYKKHLWLVTTMESDPDLDHEITQFHAPNPTLIKLYGHAAPGLTEIAAALGEPAVLNQSKRVNADLQKKYAEKVGHQLSLDYDTLQHKLNTAFKSTPYAAFIHPDTEILIPCFHINKKTGKYGYAELTPQEKIEVLKLLSKQELDEHFVHEFKKAYQKEFSSRPFYRRNPFGMFWKIHFGNIYLRKQIEDYANNDSNSRTTGVINRMNAKVGR